MPVSSPRVEPEGEALRLDPERRDVAAAGRLVEALQPRLAGLPGEALGARRGAWLERVAELGLPGRRVEEWKYTHLPHFLVALRDPAIAPAGGIEVRAEASVVSVRPLEDLARDDPEHALELLARPVPECDPAILALEAALAGRGVRVTVPAGADGGLVELDETARRGIGGTRHAIRVQDGARLRIVRRLRGGDAAVWDLGTTFVSLGRHARATCVLVVELDEGALHTGATVFDVGEGAALEIAVLQAGARLGRHETHVRLAGEDSMVRMFAANLGAGRDHLDQTTTIDHAAPNARSIEDHRAVLAGAARSVFQGRIVVRPGAAGTDAGQVARAALLSDAAEADVKPELLIHADDVQCRHGAAVGDLDRDAVFYLRSRGVPDRQARRVLAEGFVAEAVEALEDATARKVVQGAAAAALDRIAATLESAP